MSESTPMNTWRNRFACRLVVWVLTYIATDEYSRYIEGAVRYGAGQSAMDIARRRKRDQEGRG